MISRWLALMLWQSEPDKSNLLQQYMLPFTVIWILCSTNHTYHDTKNQSSTGSRTLQLHVNIYVGDWSQTWLVTGRLAI